MDNNGFVRTLEAVVAVILLLSVVYILTPSKTEDVGTPEFIKQAHTAVLSEVLFNNDFRDCLLNKITSEGALNDAEGSYSGTVISSACALDIKNFIEIHRPNGYVYLAEICGKSESCLDADIPIDKSVYVQSVLLTSENPKVFRIYFWER